VRKIVDFSNIVTRGGSYVIPFRGVVLDTITGVHRMCSLCNHKDLLRLFVEVEQTAGSSLHFV
jgi:hypothetical protein